MPPVSHRWKQAWQAPSARQLRRDVSQRTRFDHTPERLVEHELDDQQVWQPAAPGNKLPGRLNRFARSRGAKGSNPNGTHPLIAGSEQSTRQASGDIGARPGIKTEKHR